MDWSGQNSFSTKEKHFVKLLETTWTQGESIYSLENNIPTRVSNPDYSKNFIQQTPQNNEIKLGLLRNISVGNKIGSLFQELSRNLMAACLSEVGKNNQLLNKQYGNLMDTRYYYLIIQMFPLVGISFQSLFLGSMMREHHRIFIIKYLI